MTNNKLDTTDFLELFDGSDLTTLEKIILTHNGTVQSLMSVIFNTRLVIKVVAQAEYNNALMRRIELTTPDNTVLMNATSIIPLKLNDPGFIGLMREGSIGIGQALDLLEIDTSRHIMKIGWGDEKIWRVYRLTGGGIDILITEELDRKHLKTII